MSESKTGLSDTVRADIIAAAQDGALNAMEQHAGIYVNYFKATEQLLYAYKKLEHLVGDEDAYVDAVEIHHGRTFNVPVQCSRSDDTDEDILERMRNERKVEFDKTRYTFDKLKTAVNLFKDRKEFIVIRMYYFHERPNGTMYADEHRVTWEDIAGELSDLGILKEEKTARQWRNKIVRELSICLFGMSAAVSANTYRT